MIASAGYMKMLATSDRALDDLQEQTARTRWSARPNWRQAHRLARFGHVGMGSLHGHGDGLG